MFGSLLRGEHARVDIDSASKLAPARPAGDFLFVVAEVQQAAAREAGLLAGFCAELFPQFQSLGGHRQLTRIAVLLTAPAPVAA